MAEPRTIPKEYIECFTSDSTSRKPRKAVHRKHPKTGVPYCLGDGKVAENYPKSRIIGAFEFDPKNFEHWKRYCYNCQNKIRFNIDRNRAIEEGTWVDREELSSEELEAFQKEAEQKTGTSCFYYSNRREDQEEYSRNYQSLFRRPKGWTTWGRKDSEKERR